MQINPSNNQLMIFIISSFDKELKTSALSGRIRRCSLMLLSDQAYSFGLGAWQRSPAITQLEQNILMDRDSLLRFRLSRESSRALRLGCPTRLGIPSELRAIQDNHRR